MSMSNEKRAKQMQYRKTDERMQCFNQYPTAAMVSILSSSSAPVRSALSLLMQNVAFVLLLFMFISLCILAALQR